MKILLAEDDINLGKLLSMLLKKQNITVNWVQDGEAAYDAVCCMASMYVFSYVSLLSV